MNVVPRRPDKGEEGIEQSTKQHRHHHCAGINVAEQQTGDKGGEDRHAQQTVQLLQQVDNTLCTAVNRYQQQSDDHKSDRNDSTQFLNIRCAVEILLVDIANIQRRRRVEHRVKAG